MPNPAGRKRQPIEAKELKGTVRARDRKAAEGTPLVPVKLIEELPGLSDRARKWWPFFKKQLHALPVTTESDVATVQRLVETYAEVRYCMEVLEEEGWFYESETKQGIIKRSHPAAGHLSEADRRLRAYLNEFGLTPASRTRVKGEGGGGKEYKDPLGEFLG